MKDEIERQNFLKEIKKEAEEKKFQAFKKQFEKALFQKFGVTIGDCTDETTLRAEFKDGATPQEFVDFLGDKFDLTPKDSFYS